MALDREITMDVRTWPGCLLVVLASTAYANDDVMYSAGNFQADAYASLRLQAEVVDADNLPGNFEDYTGVRDAWSRAGMKFKYQASESWSFLFQYEVPLDLANLEIQSPWNQSEDERVLKLETNGPVGKLWYGRGWIAYYNNIAYPVDQFSSFYSGFATFSSLRLEDTVYYASPVWNGVQLSVSSSDDNGSNNNRRNQYAVSYQGKDLFVAVGVDDIGGLQDEKVIGLAASWNYDAWHVAIKYERFSSDITGTGWAADGTDAANILLQYTSGKHTWRGMWADVDNFGEITVHAGWDYQYLDNTRFFTEVYREQETAVIADSRQTTYPGNNTDAADSGGSALVAGIRYDF